MNPTTDYGYDLGHQSRDTNQGPKSYLIERQPKMYPAPLNRFQMVSVSSIFQLR